MWFNDSLLGGCRDWGGDGFVYFLSKTHVAKVPRNGNLEGLRNEWEVQQRLFDAGLTVPKPVGIVPVRLEGVLARLFLHKREEELALVSERMYGTINYQRLQGAHRERAEEQFHTMMAHARLLGMDVCPDDVMGNTIYNKKTGTLYLIDFMNWRQLL